MTEEQIERLAERRSGMGSGGNRGNDHMSKPIDRTFIYRTAATEMVYIAEYERRNSRALRWSAMPAFRRKLDTVIDARRVPLNVRNEARAFFAVERAT
jgi:hypothetical protein